jgi:biotin operon repressor
VDDPDFERLVGEAPHVSYAEIVRHPHMAQARKLYIERFLALYDRDAFMARLLIETGRFLVYHVAVILGAAQDPARRETWLTVGSLKRELAVFGLASDRHIDQLVARLCAVGFMTSAPAEQDGRVRILKPTERMLAHDRAWLAAHYAPLTVICPHIDYDPIMRQDPVYQVANRRMAIPFLPFSGKLLALAPDLMLFFDRAAGHMISAALLQAAMSAPDQYAAVPYADVGKRFGVSRTHVRKLLNAAQEIGLVRLQGRGGHRVQILPRLWESYDRGLAAGMFVHDALHAVVTGRRADVAANVAANAAVQQGHTEPAG